MKNFSDGLIDNDEIITCKKHTQFKTRVKNIPYFLPKWLKNIPFGGTQNYIAHKRKSSPPPRIYAIMISCKNHSLFYYFTSNGIANGLLIHYSLCQAVKPSLLTITLITRVALN